MRVDVPAHYPAESGEEQKRESAVRRKWAEGVVAEIADHWRRMWHERRSREKEKHNGSGEKKRAESLSGHVARKREFNSLLQTSVWLSCGTLIRYAAFQCYCSVVWDCAAGDCTTD